MNDTPIGETDSRDLDNLEPARENSQVLVTQDNGLVKESLADYGALGDIQAVNSDNMTSYPMNIQSLNTLGLNIHNPNNRKLGSRSRHRIKHDAFIEYYLQSFNGSDAAKLAGYRKNSQVHATKLLANPQIFLKIQERLKELKVSADETLVRLSQIARGDIRYFFNFDLQEFILDSEIAKKNSAIIKKIKQTKNTRYSKDGEKIESSQIEIELYDKQAALSLFMKYHSLVAPNDEGANINNTLIINGNVSPEFLRANNLDANMMSIELARLSEQMKLITDDKSVMSENVMSDNVTHESNDNESNDDTANDDIATVSESNNDESDKDE